MPLLGLAPVCLSVCLPVVLSDDILLSRVDALNSLSGTGEKGKTIRSCPLAYEVCVTICVVVLRLPRRWPQGREVTCCLSGFVFASPELTWPPSPIMHG